MKQDKHDIIVLSLGGSLICPDRIDFVFLKKFKKLIEAGIAKGKRFIIVTGGGSTARHYQEAARISKAVNKEDLDWLGIHATRINAHLIRAIFRRHAHPVIVKNPAERIIFKEKVLVAAGWKPGFSTDYDAVILAEQFRASEIINMSNIDQVYDRDPKRYADARPHKNLSWKDFRRIVGNRWSPGLNAPFDPIASREAEKQKMTVYIVNGKNLANLQKLLDGKRFRGTIIS